MELTQFAAIFIAAYFLSHLALAWMMPNVPASFRSTKYWTSVSGILYGNFVERCIIATVTILCVYLWTM
jgi:hypothetical protein